MIYAISCLSMKRHSAIFTFPSLAKLAVSLRAWTQLSILRNATPTDVISQYDYTYDAAGRRIEIARSGTAMSESRTDAYGYNVRNELTSATKTGGPQSPAAEYAYQYDDIGNRITSTDLGINRTYTANNLNQYSAITTSDSGLQTSSFEPQFDDDGNQTLIQTSTGVWSVQYNGENRPVLWTGGTQSAATNIVMSFDRMGRRVAKNDQLFVYGGYLQVVDNLGNTFIWDPTEPIATRPLVWNRGDSVEYYTHDGNKDVSEVITENDDVVAHYEYTSFGSIAKQRGEVAVLNPWRFSSEYVENDIGVMYYNFRHYNPASGRWLNQEEYTVDTLNPYLHLSNHPNLTTDRLGLYDEKVHFYLMYLIILDLTGEKEKALAIAQGSQYPDSREQFDEMDPWYKPLRYIWPSDNRYEVRRLLHNLNGLSCCKLREFQDCIKKLIAGANGNDFLIGVYLHVFADTISHVHAGAYKDDEECSYGDYLGHGYALKFPDDPRWVYFDQDLGKQRLRRLLWEIEQMHGGKKLSPKFYKFFESIYETHTVTYLVQGQSGLEYRNEVEYVHWLDIIKKRARKKGLGEEFEFDNVFGDPKKNKLIYKNKDEEVSKIAIPALKECLEGKK